MSFSATSTTARPERPPLLSEPIIAIGGPRHFQTIDPAEVGGKSIWPRKVKLNGCTYWRYHLTVTAKTRGGDLVRTFWLYRYCRVSPQLLLEIMRPLLPPIGSAMEEQSSNGYLCNPLKMVVDMLPEWDRLDIEMLEVANKYGIDTESSRAAVVQSAWEESHRMQLLLHAGVFGFNRDGGSDEIA